MTAEAAQALEELWQSLCEQADRSLQRGDACAFFVNDQVYEVAGQAQALRRVCTPAGLRSIFPALPEVTR